jgi:hypothetical protein
MAPPKVAVCFAGAWRDWPGAWRHIQPNIIESLGDVDIFAVSDSIPAGAHGMGDVSFTVARMREAFGARFKGGEHLSARHLENVSAHTWPSITATQAALPKHSTVFAYLYKIWRCGQLIHISGVMYDGTVRLRPDLWPTQPFHIVRIGRGDGAVYELQVGGRCVQFGSRTVVIHAYTNFCANDRNRVHTQLLQVFQARGQVRASRCIHVQVDRVVRCKLKAHTRQSSRIRLVQLNR